MSIFSISVFERTKPLLSIFRVDNTPTAARLLEIQGRHAETVESQILRLADFGLARNRLILLYLKCQLSGSNSVGRMPASNAGPASSHCPERTRDPNQFPSKVDATTPDRPTAVVRSDELETNQSRLRARADAGQLKRAWLAARNPDTVRCPAQQLVRQATMFCLHPTSRWMSIDIEKQARPSMRSQGVRVQTTHPIAHPRMYFWYLN